MENTVLRLGVALAIGFLVGLERGWQDRNEADGQRTAGIRTFTLTGLLGGVVALLAMTLDEPLVFAAGFLGFAAIFGWFEARHAANAGGFSVTGAVAGLLVFALGGLAVAGDQRAAAAGGAALAGLLASRRVLHERLQRLSWVELRSALVLAAMTLIVLPLLPDRAIDPWGGFNPREVWFFMVLTASVSFLGYIAVRLLGPARGLVVSGIAGALVSSTAVTVAFGRMARAGAESLPLAGAASLAAAVSVLRVTVFVLILAPAILPLVLPATAAAALVFIAAGLVLLARRRPGDAAPAVPRNPFELVPLFVFAAGFATVSTATAALSGRFGDSSLVVASGLSGMFDVDVAVLSALRLSAQDFDPQTIAWAVLAAAASNAIGRLVVAVASGPPRYWLPLAATAAAAIVAGFTAAPALPGW
jgi:uncharacterized membrane protein (DUF4010 family)